MAADGEAFLVGLERAVIVAGVELGIADIGHEQRLIALLPGAARVGLGEPARDGEALFVGGERAGKIAEAELGIAKGAERLRQVALGGGVG